MQTWLGRMFDTIKSDAGSFFTAMSSVVEHEVWPWVEALFVKIELDAVALAKASVEEAIAEIEAELQADLPAMLTGNFEDFLKAFNAIVAKTVQKLEAGGINIAKNDVITAVQAGIANLTAAKQT